jgi:hypothetical protein
MALLFGVGIVIGLVYGALSPAARTGAALKSFHPCIASSGTIAGSFSLLGAHEVRVWPPRQFPG